MLACSILAPERKALMSGRTFEMRTVIGSRRLCMCLNNFIDDEAFGAKSGVRVCEAFIMLKDKPCHKKNSHQVNCSRTGDRFLAPKVKEVPMGGLTCRPFGVAYCATRFFTFHSRSKRREKTAPYAELCYDGSSGLSYTRLRNYTRVRQWRTQLICTN